MKTIKLVFALVFAMSLYGQEQVVWNVTYLDVPAAEVNDFTQLHKDFTNLALGESRTLLDQWVYRHYYGSGASIVIYDLYSSLAEMEKDDPWVELRKKWEAADEDQRKSMEQIVVKYNSYNSGHYDELRVQNPETDHYSKMANDDPKWDTPFIAVIGNYNSKGNQGEFGQAFLSWSTKPLVDSDMLMGGGVSYHYYGKGTEAQFYQGFESMSAFANALENPVEGDDEARGKFWSMVEGGHQDQIYVHVGHIINGEFNLAGPNQ